MFIGATAALLVHGPSLTTVHLQAQLSLIGYSVPIALVQKIVLLIGLLGFLTDRPEFLDIALLYALVNFIGTIAILKFFRYRNMGLSSDEIASREDER